MDQILKNWQGIMWLGGSAVLGVIICLIFFKTVEVFVNKHRTVMGESIVKHGRGPSRLIIPLFVVRLLLPLMTLPPEVVVLIQHTFGLLLIGAIGWLVIKVVYILEEIILSQFRVDTADNLQARRIHTQIQILKKVVIVVVGLLTLAAILMTFEKVRYLGTSILASAGIAGLIVGFAAQRSIATLLAGIQIAITQPIRIDDVVIVENEWGRIEEITLTYVVVKIWDLRRLILPITYFLEKPFQNWTRVSADILGTVFLYVDYTVPVEAVREEFRRILEKSEKWDGRVSVLQVTNTTERTVELRALVSAGDSSSAWELRCHVREKLIEFLQKNYPHALPRLRADISDQSSMEENDSQKNQ
jgi:small-conductance mechanosensitive channel